nr:putative integron gene cassette protein [uncultured bacterium]
MRAGESLSMRRFDSNALYYAMNEKRQDRGMTWADISKEIHVSASTIRRTKAGGRMEVDGMIAMVDWLGVPVETFVRETTI